MGEPVRISVCHCRACQRRTGGPFSAQARFPIDDVLVAGESREWVRTARAGARHGIDGVRRAVARSAT
ncbi:GFA family protein [Sphingomonas sp. MMS24-JH45]